MNILLINTNPVVSRLVSLCIRDEGTVLEEVTDASAVKRDRYDMVFIDDSSYVPEVQEVLKRLMLGKKILLSGKHGSVDALEAFDEVIAKPFLPSQITAAIESATESEEVMDEGNAEGFIFPLSREEDLDKTSRIEDDTEEETIEVLQDPEILDSSEIERIKALLEEDENDKEAVQIEEGQDYETRKVEVITEHLEADGLEIISEDEIVDILSSKNGKKKAKKEKSKKEKTEKEVKKKSKKNKKEEIYTFEEALIAALEGMKPKKIKKLLKGAEVTIKINFKDKQ